MTSPSLSRLQAYYDDADAIPLLRAIIHHEFEAGEVAMSTSFGADSSILLHLVSQVAPDLPILFLETGKHFPETLEYANQLIDQLKLTNVQFIKPDEVKLQRIDSEGDLWQHQPNRCCWLRKVEPLRHYLDGNPIKALITGRKRYQTPERANMRTVEMDDDGRFRINPLAAWSRQDQSDYRKTHKLPPHPMVAQGYLSIGCAPCTRKVNEGEDERAGRWAHTMEDGLQKTECGIHLPAETPDWSV